MALPSPISTPDKPCLISCPVYLLHKWPAMQEIKWAWSWGNSQEMGQDLRILYPHGVPRFVITGVLAFNDGIHHELTRQMKEHDKT